MLPSHPIPRSNVKKTVFYTLFLTTSLVYSPESAGQLPLPFNRERAAMEKIADRQWFKARTLLQTALSKDPRSAEARYAFAVYYSSPANPRFNLDSARLSIRAAAELYRLLSPKEQDRLRKFPLDSSMIAGLGQDIASQAYAITVTEHSIEALTEFLSEYPEAKERDNAAGLRDSLAYHLATAEGSPEAFRKFMSDWPQSPRKQLAAARYEEGIFLRRTLSGTPEDLKQFLAEFPSSAYRETIVDKLFRLLTVTGTAASLRSFITEYPESRYAQVCADLLSWRGFQPGHGRWIPISDKGLFGFLNLEGRTVVKPYLLQLPEAWRCPPGDTGLVALPDAIYERSGKKLIDGNYTRATHIGSGFILAGNTSTELLHASGWKPVTGPVRDAFMIGTEFIAVKTNPGWSVHSINGVRILPDHYDSLRQEGSLITLRKNNRYYLVPAATLISHGQGKGEYMVADEIRLLRPGIFLLRNGDAQEAVNEQLQPVVDIGIQRIHPTPFGLRIDRDGLTDLTGWPGLEKKRFRSVEFQGPWMNTILGDSATLYNIPERKMALSAPDSLWYSRGFLFARKRDSIHVFTPDNKRITTGRGDITAFKTANDSSLFFLVKKKKQLVLYDISTGKKVISGIYEDIQPVNRNYFIVRLKNKSGLVNLKGKELLTADYDAILYREGWFSLLRQGKFGAYHPVSGRMIKPQFEANLIPLSTTMIMARKKQKWGVIGPAQKPELATFPFDEITPLSDTLAMARSSTIWNVIDLHSGKSIAGGITNWQEVSGADRIVLKSEGKYGMLSPSVGMVIPPRYDEILWWSDEQHFLFMGIRQENEQYASLEYFNRHGTPVRKQQVTRSGMDDFICED